METLETDQLPPTIPDEEMQRSHQSGLYQKIGWKILRDTRMIRRTDIGSSRDEYYLRSIDPQFSTYSEDKAVELYDSVVDAAIDEQTADGANHESAEIIGRTIFRVAEDYAAFKRTGVLSAYRLSDKYAPQRRKFANFTSDVERESPLNIVRLPIAITEEEVQRLSNGQEEDKLTVLSELLDPYRCRHDIDASPDEIQMQSQDEKTIITLLESMQPSWQRDLMAVNAYRYFAHRLINKPELAEQARSLVSIPELRDIILATKELAERYKPERLVADVIEHSAENLTSSIHADDSTISRLKQEAELREDEFAVTINLDIEALLQALFDSHRLLTVYDTKRSNGNRSENGYGRLKQEHESKVHDQNEALLDRPTYGALAMGDKEEMLGAAPAYGGCVVKIKPEVARSRTLYSVGDSSRIRREGQYSSRRLAYEDATAARISIGPDAPDYIEAQILGGVSPDDIDSITIDILDSEKHFGEGGYLRQIREQYPSIKLRIAIKAEEIDKVKDEWLQVWRDLGVEVVKVES